jgi:hypothetical protein
VSPTDKITVEVRPWMIIREAPVTVKEEPAPAAVDEYLAAEEAATYTRVHVERGSAADFDRRICQDRCGAERDIRTFIPKAIGYIHEVTTRFLTVGYSICRLAESFRASLPRFQRPTVETGIPKERSTGQRPGPEAATGLNGSGPL